MPVLQSTQRRPAAPIRRSSRSRSGRVRVLAYAAIAPIAGGYAAVATVLAVVVSSAPNAQFSVAGVLLAAIPGWLAAHHVPLGLDTHSFAVLPLLPTFLLMLNVARVAARAAARLRLHDPSQARVVVIPIAAAHAVVGVTIALVLGHGPVSASPPVAFFGCAAVSGLAATVGVARRCQLLDVALSRVDQVVLRGLRAGIVGLAAMTAVGALVLAFGLVVHWTTATQIFERGGSELGSEFGMLLLVVGYLPNAIVAALAFAMGPGFTMGTASLTPLHLTVTKVPAMPLFAAVPEHQSRTLLGLMVLPLAVGLFLGWAYRRVAPNPLGRWRALLVASAVVGAVFFVLAALAGGRLGGGVFSPVTAPAGLVGAVAMGWILVPGGIVAWLAGPKEPRPVAAVAPQPEPEPEDLADDDPEYDEDLDAESLDSESPGDESIGDEALGDEVEPETEPEPEDDTAREPASDGEPDHAETDEDQR